MDAHACPDCGFQVWTPVAALPSSIVGLYDDARFPGRCIVVLRSHGEHLEDLPDSMAAQFLHDARLAATVIRKVVGAERVNYAQLGNTVSHLHWHLIPRQIHDLNPTRPPWEHPHQVHPLDPAVRARLLLELQQGLTATAWA